MESTSQRDLDRRVAAAVESEPVVLAAYVFGSRARNDARDASDLDLAILEQPGQRLSLEAEDRIRRAAAKETGLSIDLARLGPAAPVLAYEVLATGRRVFVRDAETADELEEGLLRRYLDTEHLRRVQREYFFGTSE